jgi:hypothetical protein
VSGLFAYPAQGAFVNTRAGELVPPSESLFHVVFAGPIAGTRSFASGSSSRSFFRQRRLDVACPASAASWPGRWLSLAHTTPDFATVAAAVRLSSTVDELKMPQPLRDVGTTTRGGRRVIGIQSQFVHAGHPVIETLYVTASGPPLPVAQVGRSGAIRLTVTFSRWNEAVSVSAPRGRFRFSRPARDMERKSHRHSRSSGVGVASSDIREPSPIRRGAVLMRAAEGGRRERGAALRGAPPLACI